MLTSDQGLQRRSSVREVARLSVLSSRPAMAGHLPNAARSTALSGRLDHPARLPGTV